MHAHVAPQKTPEVPQKKGKSESAATIAKPFKDVKLSLRVRGIQFGLRRPWVLYAAYSRQYRGIELPDPISYLAEKVAMGRLPKPEFVAADYERYLWRHIGRELKRPPKEALATQAGFRACSKTEDIHFYQDLRKAGLWPDYLCLIWYLNLRRKGGITPYMRRAVRRAKGRLKKWLERRVALGL